MATADQADASNLKNGLKMNENSKTWKLLSIIWYSLYSFWSI